MAELRLPSGVDEWRRVVHALQAGTSIRGREAYVVASTVAPLHRVLGVVGSAREAERLAESDVNEALGWSREERTNRVIWGPIPLPDPGQKNRIEVWDHTWWTEMLPPVRRSERVPNLTLEDITRVELRIAWRREGVEGEATFEMSPQTDAIFLSRGALETFAYLHLDAVFGDAYVRALRSRLGH